MCVVSMVQEYYGDKWGRRPYGPYEVPYPPIITYWPDISDEEKKRQEEQQKKVEDFLKNRFPSVEPISKEEINEFRELLKRAREYDRKNNEPDCPGEDKRKKIINALDRLQVSNAVRDEILNIIDEKE